MPALWLISSLFHVYKLTWTAFSESLMKHIVVLSSHHAFFLSVTAINKLNRNWRTMRVLLLVVFRRPGERAPHWGNSRMVQWDVDWVPAGVGGGGGGRRDQGCFSTGVFQGLVHHVTRAGGEPPTPSLDITHDTKSCFLFAVTVTNGIPSVSSRP